MVEPLVLPDTPEVLSIGKCCMQMGYGFYWHQGQNPFLVTPDGSVIPFLVGKDIPYLAVGSSRSIPKRPKQFVEIPVAPVVERGPQSLQQQEHMDVDEKQDVETTTSPTVKDLSSDKTIEDIRERYPYGYSGELSGECEIPLAVLKQVYDDYGSEIEDDEWRENVAMVVEEPIPEGVENHAAPAVSEGDRDGRGHNDRADGDAMHMPPCMRRRLTQRLRTQPQSGKACRWRD
jgi:hypothetical protein